MHATADRLRRSADVVGSDGQRDARRGILADRHADKNTRTLADPIAPDPGATARPPHPVRLVVTDDLRRSRLTVVFRLLLAIPHLLWVGLWGLAAFVLAFVVWLAILVEGRAPRVLHDFLATYVRYSTQVAAYLYLAGNPYPAFTGGSYPVDVEIDPPQRQGRLGAAFRLVLAVPVLLLSLSLSGGPTVSAGTLAGVSFTAGGGGALAAAGFLGWFAALARARMPHGLRDLGTYALGYGAQATAYVLLLTDRYPNSDPAVVEPTQALPLHPVRIEVTDSLRRSRLTVFFRVLLVVPHLFWLALWSVLAVLAALVGWPLALLLGRLPTPLHRFLAAFVRYVAGVYAFLFLVGGPFPGFVGATGSYPVGLTVEPPRRQHRLVTLFRLVLAFPALVVAGAYGGALPVVALLGWWHALVTGRMPEGIRNLGAAAIRYNGQVGAYLLLLTDRYPYATPALRDGSPPPPADLPSLPDPLDGTVLGLS